MAMQWTAIILAGQRPGTDPLAAHFGMEYKALVPLDGEAMLTHVVRSLHQCEEVGRIVILGQQPGALALAAQAGGGGELRPSHDGISKSLLSLLASGDVPLPWLVTTADHPLLTPAMVREFLANTQGDLSVGMVEKQVMLARFPESKRTWLNFADGSWSGANLFAFSSDKVTAALDLWAAAEQDRKKAWKLFLHFGPLLALRALTRTIELDGAFKMAGKRLGLSAHLIALSDPVAAIDVDKAADHALAMQIIASRKAL
ncbi:MAG: NTP transferase domain-containing protein [Sphingomonadales bacterium]|nr:NTP transferase domain-containing protein [Sphingomonadales bacterium]